MPLQQGSSQETISSNISELEHSKTAAGKQRSHAQNVAIAMSEAGKSKKDIPMKKKKTGKVDMKK